MILLQIPRVQCGSSTIHSFASKVVKKQAKANRVPCEQQLDMGQSILRDVHLLAISEKDCNMEYAEVIYDERDVEARVSFSVLKNSKQVFQEKYLQQNNSISAGSGRGGSRNSQSHRSQRGMVR